MRRNLLRFTLVATLTVFAALPALSQVLVPRASSWKYLDGGTSPGASWTTLNYDDSAWSSGTAPLGDNLEGTVQYCTTVVNIGPANGRVPSVVFRKKFNVANASIYSALSVRLQRDDGAVVYLNGIEIARDGVAPGSTLTDVATQTIGFPDETNYVTFSASASALVTGTNILAVEVHQVVATSSDLQFDVELAGSFAPTIAITNPADGATVTSPVTLTATASDPDGTISRVDFYEGTSLLGSVTGPYTVTASNLFPEGNHTFTATATDNDGNAASSSPITLNVSDSNPPRLVSISAISNKVTVVFSKNVLQPSATTAGNYGLSPSGSILSAAYGSSSNVIELTATTLTAGNTYTLTVNSVTDRAGNVIAPNSTLTFRTAAYVPTDIGNPPTAGNFAGVAGGFNYSGSGTNLGLTSDQISFAYSERAGDFDIQVRLASLNLADTWAKAGLMARESLAATSRNAAAIATPSAAGASFQYRPTTGAATISSGLFPVNYPNTYLRLKRQGSVFTGYASWDGQNWSQLGSTTLSGAPNTMFLGFVIASTSSQTVTASFRDVQEASGGTFAGFSLPIEPMGPSSRKTPFAITEIMYNPFPSTNASGGSLEFVEIYNSNPFFEEISRFRLSGDIDYTFPQGTFLQGGEYVVVARDPAALQSAYNLSGVRVLGPYSSTNTLKSSGTIRLRNNSDGIVLEVPYLNDPPWPVGADGTGHSLVLARPSYGEGFPQAWEASHDLGGSPGHANSYSFTPQRNVVVNEFLANSQDPDVDYVELYNHSNSQVDLSGCTLSDEAHTNKFVIPNGTAIPARGFIVFYQTALGFGLSSGGETIYFRDAGGRVLDTVKFEAQAVGVSSGRYPDGAKEFYPLAAQTRAAPNAPILIRDIVINEIMYKPISGNNDDEYVELYNKGTNAVNLGRWRFIAGITYTFPSNTVLSAGGYLVVAKNALRLMSNYANLNTGNTLGDYGGSLGNRGERLALAMPDFSYTTNSQGVVSTNTVYVVVDEVTYGIGGNWGNWANEGGSSLELIDPRSNHRLAHNWGDSDETSKAPWTLVEATGAMDNGGSTANFFEVLTMGEGEYLLDNAQAIPQTGVPATATNYVSPANSTFESGLGDWRLRGTHIRSTIENNEGYNSSKSLHIRATARGDTQHNRDLVQIPTLGTASPVTLRAYVRWLRGWPEILLRVKGNYMEAVGRLTIPANLGTPGQRNSRALANNAPAVFDVKHTPVVPAANEDVVVTARVHDPDGLTSIVLNYRIEPSQNFTPITMLDNGTLGDTIAGDGIYSGTIPGQSSNTMVAFIVVATDSLGASRTFPLQDPTYKNPFECMVYFGDSVPSSAFGTYRQWMSVANINDWIARPALSNERLYETFVYGNYRAIYNAAVKWAGSPYHQFSGNPATTHAHYSIDMPLDDMVLGTENFNKIHAPGNGPFGDQTLQREQVCYWMARQMNLPWGYRRYVNMFFNGNRRSNISGGVAQDMMEDSQTPGSDMIEEFFPDNTDGDLYKQQPWFEQDDPSSGANNQSWCTILKFTTLSNSIPVHKTARYRYNYLTRGAHGTANDYRPVFDLVEAASLTGPPQASAFNALVDTEEYFRIFAVEHASGNWDAIGSQNQQNMYGYKPEGEKWRLMIWDWNIVLGSANSDTASWGVGVNLNGYVYATPGPNDLNMTALFTNPPLRRIYLRGLKELMNGPMLASNVEPMMDAKYRAFLQSGISPRSAFGDAKTFISGQRGAIQTLLNQEEATAFKLTVNNNITTSNNLVTITGESPVQTRTILINGIEYPVTWISVKTWSVQVPLNDATNQLGVQAYDTYGNPVTGFNTNITVIYNGPPVIPPDKALVFNEIMYNPLIPGSSFIEIYNRSPLFAFDMSGWRLSGLSYTFPSGSIITPGQYMVLAKDRGALGSAFGAGTPVFATFDGQLSNGGETLALIKPGTNGSPDLVVDAVRYSGDTPWPASADGAGPSLQLLDNAQDNSRVSNWSDGQSWRFYTYTGIPGSGATRLSLFISAVGDIYVDNCYLTLGSVPETGPNLLANGDFEAGLAPWTIQGNHSNSVVATGIAYNGTKSLHIISAGIGGSGGQVGENLTGINASSTYTFSFWYLPTTNAATMDWRLSSNFRTGLSNNPAVSVRPLYATPGAANATTVLLPPYPTLWINEVQAVNVDGVTDNFGEHDPWIELYNGGTNVIDLNGMYLANNFASLTQWPFPAGATINPGEYKLIWADGQPAQTTATQFHTSFTLNAPTGSVAIARLLNGQPQIVDYLNYSGQQLARSYGDFPDGQVFDQKVFFLPTPGAPNVSREVDVFINEWMAQNSTTLADPADGDFEDWIELYNASTNTVDLSGYWMTDNLANHTQFKIPNGTLIPAGGYLLVWADGETAQNSTNRADIHANFNLRAAGEAIGLYAPNGTTVIDEVTFLAQTNDVSQGRFPDAAPSIHYMTHATPRAANVLGGGANTAPALDPISDKYVVLGETLTFTAHASDADIGQILTYTLSGAPSGAAIGPANGVFNWTPSVAQTPSANPMSVVVTDDGSPAKNASQTFTIYVSAPPAVGISRDGANITLAFPTAAGRQYQVQYKNQLSDATWTNLGPAQTAVGSTLQIGDNIGAQQQRFYRLTIVGQ